MSMNSTTTCAFTLEGAHHSDDRVTVYHGLPEPLTVCGFHALPANLPDVFKWVRLHPPEPTAKPDEWTWFKDALATVLNAETMHDALELLARHYRNAAEALRGDRKLNQTWQDERDDDLAGQYEDTANELDAVRKRYSSPTEVETWLRDYEATEIKYQAEVDATIEAGDHEVPDKVMWAHDDRLADLAHRAARIFGQTRPSETGQTVQDREKMDINPEGHERG